MEKGDKTINYFHWAAKVRRHKSKINALRDNAGNIFTSRRILKVAF